jgi:hypothetical protein
MWRWIVAFSTTCFWSIMYTDMLAASNVSQEHSRSYRRKSKQVPTANDFFKETSNREVLLKIWFISRLLPVNHLKITTDTLQIRSWASTSFHRCIFQNNFPCYQYSYDFNLRRFQSASELYWATAAGRRMLVPTFADRRVVEWSARRVRTTVNLCFLGRRIHMTNTKQTPWPLVRERTIPTERPPFVDEI